MSSAALTEQDFKRPMTTAEDAAILIAVREVAAECEALLREKLDLMRRFVDVSTKLLEARIRYDSLRSSAFSGVRVPRYDADGNECGSTREDILDPGPVVTMEHLVATDYSVKALRDSFVQATNYRS